MCLKGTHSCRLLIQVVQNKKDTDQQKTIYNVSILVKFEGNKTVIEVELFNTVVSLQIDSGATVSILNVNAYKKLNSPRLQKCDRILHAFGQQQIPGARWSNTNLRRFQAIQFPISIADT